MVALVIVSHSQALAESVVGLTSMMAKDAKIAAAGGHSLLMSGPPGTGKSMLARRLPGTLPDMTP